MNRDGDIGNFWSLIERKMSIIFPNYLRNILKLRGYDNAGSIKYITKKDIDSFETFAKTAMVKCLPDNFNRPDYFSIFTGPDDFEIIPGHKILLEEVVIFIKEMTEKHGKEYFNFYDSVSASVSAQSQSFVNMRASQVLTKSKEKMSGRNSLPSYDEDETEKAEDLAEDTYIKQEQDSLIKKVKAWLTKKANTQSEKYSNEINEDTVVMNVKTVGNIKKLCAHIKCFICEELIRMSEIRKVLADYSFETYLSASNFYTHIQLHQKKNEMRIGMINTTERNEDDNGSFFQQTKSEQQSKVLKSASKSKKILNRFRAQSHEMKNTFCSNKRQNVKYIPQPHTVTSQYMKGCKRPHPDTEDINVKASSKSKRNTQNESEPESVSQLGLQSTEKFEEMSIVTTAKKIVNLTDVADEGFLYQEAVQSSTKEVLASIRKEEHDGFQPEPIKISKASRKTGMQKTSAKAANHIAPSISKKKKSRAHFLHKKPSEAFTLYGGKKQGQKSKRTEKFYSEDDLGSDVDADIILKTPNNKKSSNEKTKKNFK